MTFKGMLKILINEYRKQHEQKMFTLVQELIQTQRELREVKEQLRILQIDDTGLSSENADISISTIPLFVQYNGFFNQLFDVRQTMTVKELLSKLRHITGISDDSSIRLRVLSEDGLTTVFFLRQQSNRTLKSYNKYLKPRMILSIEHIDDEDQSNSTASSVKTHSFDESDV